MMPNAAVSAATPRLVPQAVFADPVASILVVKLDHIGDFMIASPALRRLRAAFPDAQITLACGPWNRQLALGLGVFDAVVPFDFFPEQTRDLSRDHDERHRVADLHRRFGALFDGHYDLAIDLRYDADTRRLLTMVDARRRIGVADTGEFPFLDLVLPSDRPEAAPRQSDGEVRHFEVGFAGDGGRVWIDAARRDVAIRFRIERPVSPLSLNLSTDDRRLGISLHRLMVTRLMSGAAGWYADDLVSWGTDGGVGDGAFRVDETISLDASAGTDGLMRSGFAMPEAFGTWSVAPTAELVVPLLVGIHCDLRLCLDVRGYVPLRGDTMPFDLWAGDVRLTRATVSYGDEARSLVVPIPAGVLAASAAVATSAPFTVGLGEASVRLRVAPFGRQLRPGRGSATIEILNGVDRVLARRAVSADAMSLAGAIEFVQDDPASPLRVRLTVSDAPFSRGFFVDAIQVVSRARRYPPRVHVLDWCGGLIDLAIRHFRRETDMIDLPAEALPAAVLARLDADAAAGRKTVLIALGANKDVTKWPLAHFAELIAGLLRRGDCAVYLVGAAREADEAQLVIDAVGSSDALTNVCGATSLLQLRPLLDRADLFIGGSTGTTHAAAMSGVTTLALLSATNHPNQWAPLGANASFLSLDVPCRECHIVTLADCSQGYRCMIDLTPGIVADRVTALLGDAPAPFRTQHPGHGE